MQSKIPSIIDAPTPILSSQPSGRLSHEDIDAALAERDDPKITAALTAMDDAQGVNADQHAAELSLAQRADVPLDVVQRNKAEVEKKVAALSPVDKLAILKEAPGAEDFMAKNAKLVADDFSIVGKWNRNLNDLPKSFQDSKDQQRVIELANKDMYGTITPDEAAELDATYESIGGQQRGTGDFLSKGVQYTAQNSVQLGRTVAAGGAGAVVGGVVGAGVGAGVGLAGGPFAEVTVPAGTAQGARMGAKWGGGAAAAYENFTQQAGLVYADMRTIKDENTGAPLDKNIARGASIAVGAVNAGLDIVGLDKLAETFPGFEKLKGALTREGIKKALAVPGMKEAFMRIGQKFATGVGVEATTEAAQQATQIIGEELSKQADSGTFKGRPLDQALDEIWQNFEGGAAMATVIGGAGSGFSAANALRRKQGVMTPSETVQHVDNINQAVRADKLYQRSPQAFNELVSGLSGEDRFYVNAEAAHQVISSLPPEQQGALFNAVPDLKTELETAQASGGDVAIKKSDYATYIAPSPQADLLREHIKLDPADMSMAERIAQQEFLKSNPETAKQIMDQVATLPPDASYQEQVGAIERLVRKSMIEGGLSAPEAKAQASLYARSMARFSAAFGQSGIDAINKGLLEFQTVDETGKPIKTGSNFSVLLNDLERLNRGERLPGADEHAVAAVKAFAERLKTAGLTVEQAKNLSSKELLDQVYPDTESAVQLGDQTIPVPNVEVGQAPDGGLNISVKPGEPAAPEKEILHQRYPEKKPKAQVKGLPPDGAAYNGTRSPEFKEWFGDSKIVNKDGSPRIMYHGTGADIEAFALHTVDEEMGGFYFTSKPRVANMYADNHDAGNVIPVYLSIKNPYETTERDWVNGDSITPEAAKALGHDGYVIQGQDKADTVIAFQPEQIKSIFNSGTFSPVDPNILKQDQPDGGPERGFIVKEKDFASRLRSVIVAFTESKNFSTGAHEFAHWGVATHRIFAEMARERIAAGDTNPEVKRIADDWEALKEFVGAKGDKFTEEQEEKAARAFEAYMREGHAPSEALRRIFTRFRDWLVKIYKDLAALDVKMDDNIRGVFDRWLASEDEIAKVKSKNDALAQIAVAFGLPADISDRIADYVNSATAKAEETLYRKLTAEQRRRETKAYKQEFAAMKKKVAEEFGARKEYNLVNYLKENRLKIYVGPETEAQLGVPQNLEDFNQGDAPTLEEIQALHDEANSQGEMKQQLVQALLARKVNKPRTLIGFLRSRGGVKDKGGDLKAMDTPPGLINNKSGMSLDDARIAAMEAGYLRDVSGELDINAPQAPSDGSINDLLDAVAEDARGNPVYSEQDSNDVLAYNDRLALEEFADREGVTLKDIEQAKADRRKNGNYAHLFTTQAEAENATNADDLAEMNGYASGADMIRTIRNLPQFGNVVEREARDRLMSKYPDMIAQGRIQNKAVDAIVNDRVLLALDLLIKELGRAKGDNSRVGMKQFALVMAQAQVEKMKVSESNYAFRYDVQREKEMRAALQASRAGKPDEAILHLQRAMVNQAVYKNLQEFADLRDRADALFKRVDEQDKDLAPTKDIDFLGAARFILYKFGLGGENFDINAWLDDIQQRNPDVMRDLIGLSQMVASPTKTAKELSISEFRDIYNSVKNIYATAHNMKELEIAGKRVKTDDAVKELIDQMGDVKAALHDSTQITGINKFRNNLSSLKAALRRVELWTKAMDGGDAGPFRKYIWSLANAAEDNYKADRIKWMDGYRDILKEHKDLLNQRVKIATQMVKTDALGRATPLTFKDKMELIGFMLHTGNASNLDKLLGGYGIDPAEWAREKDRLEANGTITEKDWQLVQKLWNYVAALKPLSQAAHKKLYGFRFEEIENDPITTKFGTFPGGYWPAIADSDQATNNKSVEQMLDDTRQYILATTGKGFTKSRVTGYREPLKTDLRLGSQHIDKVLRFVHLEPATRDISRIINRREFKDNMRARDHDAVDGMLMPWLQRFATQTMEAPAQMGDRSASMGRRTVRFMQSAVSSQIIRYNLVVALQNIANLPVALHLVGAPQFAKSFITTTINPLGTINDMRKASKAIDERLSINAIKASQEINQIAERKGKYTSAKDFALRHGPIFMRAIDSYLSAVVWHAGYNKAQADGMSDVESIDHADSVVRQVMGATGSKDISKFEASHPVMKLLVPFYQYFNSQANLIGTEFGNIMKNYGWAGTPRMFGAYLSLIAAPALMGQFITDGLRKHLPGEDDDDGDPVPDWLAWATTSQLRYLAAMVPFVGPGINAILNAFNKNPMDDRLSVPILSLGETVVRTGKNVVKKAAGDEVDDSRLIRDAMSSVGMLFNIPLGQVAKPISYAVDVSEGNSQPDSPLAYMRGLVAGPPPKNR